MGSLLAEHKIGMEVFQRLIKMVKEEQTSGLSWPMPFRASFVPPIDFPINDNVPLQHIPSISAAEIDKVKPTPATFVVVTYYVDGQTPVVIE